MKIESNNKYIDKYVWRCHTYYIKKNIRAESIFDFIKMPINVIYYLAFKFFINHYNLN